MARFSSQRSGALSWSARLAVFGLAICVALTAVDAKVANVVHYEPQLPLEYSNVIHPYAWAHRRPDPYYSSRHTAYTVGQSHQLSSFLETQTQITASRDQRGIFDFLTNKEEKPNKLIDYFNHPEVNQEGHFYKLKTPHGDNPAVEYVRAMDPSDTDFKTSTNKKTAAGTWLGEHAYRRAVYGTRRRRIPYDVSQGTMASVNPFRRPNNFFTAPNDMMKAKDPFFAAKHPEVWDQGLQSLDSNKLPYGGFSSFKAALMRRRVSERGMNRFDSGTLAPMRPPVGGFPVPMGRPVPFLIPPPPLGPNFKYMSDGTPVPTYHEAFGGAPTFVPGDNHKFYDFSSSSGSLSSSSAGAAAASAGAPAPAPAQSAAAAAPPASA